MKKKPNETWRQYVSRIGKGHGQQIKTEKYFDFAIKNGLSGKAAAEYALAELIK